MDFDENQWYHLYIGGSKGNAFVGTPLVFGDPNLEDTTKHNSTTGAVFMSTNQLKNDNYEQKWQIIAIDAEYYVLRTAASGPNGYLATYYTPKRENLTSHTLARMVRDNVSDASIYWKISNWSSNTFKLTNKANGTEWPLEIGGEGDTDDGTEARIMFNLVKSTPRREFSFEAITEVNGTDIGKIDNADFSRAAISLPATTVLSSSNPSSVSTVTPSSETAGSVPTTSMSTTPSNAAGGLSTGAKVGIGAGIGGAAIIALIVLGLFLLRARKRRASPPVGETEIYAQDHNEGVGKDMTTTYGHDGFTQKAELDSTLYKAELPLMDHAPAELPGSEVPRQELAEGKLAK